MNEVRRYANVVLNYTRVAGELARAYPLSFPAKVAKVAYGRARYGVPPAVSVGMGVVGLAPHQWKRFAHKEHRLAPFRIINFRHGADLFRNKVALLDRVAEHGLPCARSYSVDDLPRLGSAELFIKPADDFGGSGAFVAKADEPGLAVRAENLLIQPRLRSHPDLADIGGNFGLPTLRVQTVLTPEGGRVVDIVAKVLLRPNLVDNWSGGSKGNLIAGVDLRTGRLTAAYGVLPGMEHLVRRIDRHPATGTPFTGFPLPEMEALIDVGQRLAEAFSDAPMLGSDIALTEDGPVIIEPNLLPEMNLPQIVRKEGVRDFLPGWIAMVEAPAEVKSAAIAALGH